MVLTMITIRTIRVIARAHSQRADVNTPNRASPAT
jgi:hypothetical protein